MGLAAVRLLRLPPLRHVAGVEEVHAHTGAACRLRSDRGAVLLPEGTSRRSLLRQPPNLEEAVCGRRCLFKSRPRYSVKIPLSRRSFGRALGTGSTHGSVRLRETTSLMRVAWLPHSIGVVERPQGVHAGAPRRRRSRSAAATKTTARATASDAQTGEPPLVGLPQARGPNPRRARLGARSPPLELVSGHLSVIPRMFRVSCAPSVLRSQVWGGAR